MTITRKDLVEAVSAELLAGKDPPEKLLEIAEAIADRLRLETSPRKNAPSRSDPESPSPESSPEFYDLRLEQDYRYPYGVDKVRRGRSAAGFTLPNSVLKRPPHSITGVVLHQMAVEYGVSPQQVAASAGDAKLALARRALEVACHAVAFRAGFYVVAHELVDYVYHGNGFNGFSLGLEVDGRYAGLEDDPTTVAREDLRSTWKGPPTKLVEQTVEAARAALRYLVEEGRRQGMPIEFLWAHRQSSGTRRSDPGQALWKALAPWAVAELHLKVELDRTFTGSKTGPGRAIPFLWDAAGTAPY